MVELRPSVPYWMLAEVYPEFLVAEVFLHGILLHLSQEEIESVSKTRVISSCSLIMEVAPSQCFHILLVRTNYSEEEEEIPQGRGHREAGLFGAILEAQLPQFIYYIKHVD